MARVARLLEHILDGKSGAGKTAAALLKIAPSVGLFLNQYTLEIDLFEAGLHSSMTTVLAELAESGAAKTRATGWSANPKSCDKPQLLIDIEAIGTGRFAQRLASNIKDKTCPQYILEAIQHVAARCH